MNDDLYDLHRAVEDRHWWFVGRRRIVERLLRRVLPAAPRPLIVEVGCGTGGNLAKLSRWYSCVGIDTSARAISHARTRAVNVRWICGTAPDDLGPTYGEARVVLLLDVLEHVADDFALFSRLLSGITPGGHVLIMVPADPALWTQHDVSYGHYRRYLPGRLTRLWHGLPVTLRLLSYFNTRLWPIVKLVRAVSRWRGHASGGAESDLALPPAPLNRLLETVLAGEATALIAALDQPQPTAYAFGVSLIALVRREAGHCPVRTRPAGVVPDQHDPQRLASA
jgi:SAM-dependent methyltransferase